MLSCSLMSSPKVVLKMVPRRSVYEAPMRAASLSPISGPETDAFACTKSRSPPLTSTLRFRREARLARSDVDGAGGRVLAVQRALRTAQHFDLLDIEEVERRRGAARVVDLVDVEADALLDAVVRETEWRTETADVHGRVALVAGIELDRRLQLVEPADA